MHWFFLALAIIFEVAGTTGMKLSHGFTKGPGTLLMVVGYLLCFTFLTLALKKIDISVAYAIWAGVGTTLITIVGLIFFHEPTSALKIGGVALIIAGVVALQLSGGH